MHPLDGAFFKFKRAQYHFNALQQSIQLWKDSKPYKLVGRQVEGDEWNYLMIVEERFPVPQEINLITGDLCNNLRSVLDYILWQLWLLANPTFDGIVTFPIFDTPTDFNKRATRHISGLSNRQRALIEGLQPYNTGKKGLSILRDLNNRDKHRMIQVVVLKARFDDFSIENPPGQPAVGWIRYSLAESVEVKNGAILGKLMFDPSLGGKQMNVRAEFSFDMSFRGSRSADGLIVQMALQDSLFAVHDALLQLETAFPGASVEKVLLP